MVDDIDIEPYTKAMSASCLSLERQCPQGRSFRLRFERRDFHSRSESYDDWSILVARTRAGQPVGTLAWAAKSLRLRGEPVRAAFFYDARVHPGFRGQRLASRLARAASEQLRARGI